MAERLHDGTTKVINMRGMDRFDRSFHRVVRIDRASMFGNPFRLNQHGNRDEVCDKYQAYFDDRVENDPVFVDRVLKLRGRVLGCWCKPDRCHGDTIMKFLEEHDAD